MAPNGDLLLYGCDLASSEDGRVLVETLATLTGADVAASTNDTGHARFGADWNLEYHFGQIETGVVFTAAEQASWDGLLNTFTVTNTNDAGAGSLRQAILDANALAGTDTITFAIGLNDTGHVYYQDDGIAGSLGVVATTTLGDAAITDFDPDYPAGMARSWYRIQPTSALPTMTGAVIIDGSTQTGYIAGWPVVEIDGSAAGSGAYGLWSSAGDSTIRGLVINNFSLSGIRLDTAGGNLIVGNFIGTDASGTRARGNDVDGIEIFAGSDNNTLGGTPTADRNLISGNTDDGIEFDMSAGNIAIGNYIGTDVTGTQSLGNLSDGILVENSLNNRIGGTAAGEGNLIAHNGGIGIDVTGTGTRIQGNSIHSNVGLGIDLTGDGVTANDPDDPDAGGNDLQNYPVLFAATTNGVQTTVTGTLNSLASTTFRIEFFASTSADGTGYGEGQRYLGFVNVSTDGAGNATINTTLSAGASDGEFISATATNSTTNDSSEFAQNVTATFVNTAPTITSNGGAATTSVSLAENTTAVTTVTGTDEVLPGQTLTYSIIGGADAANFAIDSSSGALTFIAAPNSESPTDIDANNTYDVLVQVFDGSLTDTQAISVTVTDVDEFDVGVVTDSDGAVNSVAENAGPGTAAGMTGLATDADATTSTITYTLDDDAGGRFAIDSVTGVVTVTGALDFETATSHNITVRAASSDGSFSTQAFLINVTDVNEFAVATPTDINPASNNVDENAVAGTAAGITAFASDADTTNNSVTYSLDDDAGGRYQIDSASGIISVLNGTVLDRETAASHNITVRASSSDGSSAIQVFTININDVNEFSVGPVTDANGAANSVNENATAGTTVGITAQAVDNDATNGIVSWSLTDDAGGRFVVDPVTGVITVAGQLDFEAATSHAVTVRALSQDGSVSFQTFNIPVNDLNEAPAGVDSTVSTLEDSTLTLFIANFGFSDPDAGDTLSDVRIDFLPAAGQLVLNGATVVAGQVVSAADIVAGNLNWQPPADAFGNGIASLGFTVADSGGLFSTSGNSIVFNVLPMNDNPVANPATSSSNEDTGLSGNVSGSDNDSPSSGWNYQLLTGPASASSFVLNPDGSFSYMPSQDFNGTDSFVFRMLDGQGGTSDATVTINLVPVNDSPISITDVFPVLAGSTLTETLGVLANDFDVENDPLIAVLVMPPSSGTITFSSDGTFLYTPANGFFGVDHFSYLATDGQANGTPVQVTIHVDAVFGGGSGSSTGLDSRDDDSNEDSLLYESDALKNLLLRLSRLNGGADPLGETIDESPGGSSAPAVTGFRLSASEQWADDSSETRLIEQLATSLEKFMGPDCNLELETVSGGPRLVFSMDGIWESLVDTEREARASSQQFSVSRLALGTGTVTFAAAVSYLLWYLRGGVLMATLLTQIPAWRMIDPLPILETARSKKRDAEDELDSYFG